MPTSSHPQYGRPFRTRGARNHNAHLYIRARARLHAALRALVHRRVWESACKTERGGLSEGRYGQSESERVKASRAEESRNVDAAGVGFEGRARARVGSVVEGESSTRPGSFKPGPATTLDFAVCVLCRVDTGRDILTRQTAAVAPSIGISPRCVGCTCARCTTEET